MRAQLALVVLVALLAPAAAVAFDNTAPNAAQQWYLDQDDAWTFWPVQPTLKTVKVAVIDSGIDAGNPAFSGEIAGGVSFVGGSWRTDSCGHGTFVAGEIASHPADGEGIDGMAFNAKLLIAKVVRTGCDVSTPGEIKAIYWAVHHGARVINLSIGGLRDPQDSELDSYSPGEQAAIEYAYGKDVLVVAAVGNGTQAPQMPWPYADYPAALPHVLGVAAVKDGGDVPAYSNRDQQYVDIAAPGGPIFSVIPRNLVDTTIAGCSTMTPYSDCGPAEFQNGIGTSFSAAQVSAAAALLIGVDPALKAGQVEWLLERSATDADPASGCPICPVGRDSLTGFGTLDVEAALKLLGNEHDLPTPDAYEPNDDADMPGAKAWPLKVPQTIEATLDFWDDPIDVYAIRLDQGETVFIRLDRSRVPNWLTLWRPGTKTVLAPPRSELADEAARGAVVGGQERLSYRVTAGGIYYVEVRAGAGMRRPDRYQLSVAISAPTANRG